MVHDTLVVQPCSCCAAMQSEKELVQAEVAEASDEIDRLRDNVQVCYFNCSEILLICFT